MNAFSFRDLLPMTSASRFAASSIGVSVNKEASFGGGKLCPKRRRVGVFNTFAGYEQTGTSFHLPSLDQPCMACTHAKLVSLGLLYHSLCLTESSFASSLRLRAKISLACLLLLLHLASYRKGRLSLILPPFVCRQQEP